MFCVFSADMYKLFRRKSFYVFLLCSAVLVCFIAYFTPTFIKLSFGLSPNAEIDVVKLLNVNAFYFLNSGVEIMYTIITSTFIAMFLAYEFSSNGIERMLIRGVSRFKIYFSKIFSSCCIATIFLLLNTLSGFFSGWYFFGLGEFNQNSFLGSLRIIGFYELSLITFCFVLVMLAFLIKKTSPLIIAVLACFMAVPPCLVYLDNLIKMWFNVEIISGNYWFVHLFHGMNFTSKESIILYSIACLSYVVVSCLVGVCFLKRQEYW
ncbi:MAG: ABC transporter permease [Candidatus Improbicoccus pseudotrichonymphae]|uniref:ABC transporter permease n=1 Tax=Candidatus Improbicoccus pseudotrichonymphae TaxID=3033792 RepID=A0AA48HYB0_9FIRM|nr:MAG: ABC transporter permease [Candidatus Improbicoccus pseudotrichonymphae]